MRRGAEKGIRPVRTWVRLRHILFDKLNDVIPLERRGTRLSPATSECAAKSVLKPGTLGVAVDHETMQDAKARVADDHAKLIQFT